MSANAHPVLILDNGAHTIKAGLSSSTSLPRKIYNAAIRSKGDKHLYIGHEFEKCRDYASLHYRLAFERGYLTDWDVQKAVWDGVFGPDVFSVDFQSTSLLITEPPFNLHSIQEKYDQLVFEEYEFASYIRCPAAFLAPHGTLFSSEGSTLNLPYPECSLIVDSGFSFTHILPVMQGNILWNGARRIDVGGKLLTNHLSTLVSFRQWNMLDQTHIVNDVKEKCCYVTSSFSSDLDWCRSGGNMNNMTLQYVLPDFSRNRHGYVRGHPVPFVPRDTKTAAAASSVGTDANVGFTQPDAREEDSLLAYEEPAPSDSDQILYMSNERFTVPELVFNPGDIGLAQSGLPQTIAHSIASLPSDLQGMFWANIGLIGGNVKFPGLGSRLQQELRALAPVEYEVSVYESKDPVLETYKAAHAFANSEAFPTVAVTREEYNEGGTNVCRRKLRQFDWDAIRDKADESFRVPRRERDKGKAKTLEESDGEDSEEPRKKTARRAPPKRIEKKALGRPRREASRAK